MGKCAIVLAAGSGKRMKSKMPKPMLEVLFVPMLQWVLNSLDKAGVKDVCIVCPPDSDMSVKYGERYETVIQAERLGTGHAVMQAKDFLEKHSGDEVIVLNGDAPFCGCEAVTDSYGYHTKMGNSATVITAVVDDPTGYGRIVRDEAGLKKIVEQKDADVPVRAVKEINSGAYWFKAGELLSALEKITNRNASREYYLTDTIAIFKDEGKRVDACVMKDSDIVLGANTQHQLFKLNQIANKRGIKRHMENGVRFIATESVIIADDAEIGCDTVIMPGTVIKPGCKIGEGCVIGPNAVVENTTVCDGAEIICSYVKNAQIKENEKIPPYQTIEG